MSNFAPCICANLLPRSRTCRAIVPFESRHVIRPSDQPLTIDLRAGWPHPMRKLNQSESVGIGQNALDCRDGVASNGTQCDESGQIFARALRIRPSGRATLFATDRRFAFRHRGDPHYRRTRFCSIRHKERCVMGGTTQGQTHGTTHGPTSWHRSDGAGQYGAGSMLPSPRLNWRR